MFWGCGFTDLNMKTIDLLKNIEFVFGVGHRDYKIKRGITIYFTPFRWSKFEVFRPFENMTLIYFGPFWIDIG